MIFDLKKGESVDQREIIRKLVALQYKRNDQAFARGNFRVRGDNLEIFPSHYEDSAWRISFFGDEVEEITEFDPLTGKKTASLDSVRVFANSHYVTPGPTLKQAMEAIRHELAERLKELQAEGRLLEAQRLEQRTNFDLEMIAATGSCAGSRITAASSPAGCRASRRRPCSNICPTMRCCSSTKATRRCRRSGRWRAATTGGRSRSPNMASACRAASTTGRCASTNGTRCARSRCSSRDPGPVGNERDRRRVQRAGHPPDRASSTRRSRSSRSRTRSTTSSTRPRKRRARLSHLVTTLTKRMAEDLTEYLHEAGLKVRYMHSTSRRWSASS
jgi:excinuclease ABC subunit B